MPVGKQVASISLFQYDMSLNEASYFRHEVRLKRSRKGIKSSIVTYGDRFGSEPLCQREALLFLAGVVSGHQGNRGQGAVGAHQAFRQPGASGVEVGGLEPVAQRFGVRRLLSPPLRPHGQASGQHRRCPQARPSGVLHAHPQRRIR